MKNLKKEFSLPPRLKILPRLPIPDLRLPSMTSFVLSIPTTVSFWPPIFWISEPWRRSPELFQCTNPPSAARWRSLLRLSVGRYLRTLCGKEWAVARPKRPSVPMFAIWPWMCVLVWRKIRPIRRSQRKPQRRRKGGANPEMDNFAKIVSGHLKTQPASPHPDPDLLTAFAENALPKEERNRLLKHLGTCSDCRVTVFIALPDSAESQKVLAVGPRR